MSDLIQFGVHFAPEGLGFNEVKAVCLEAERFGYDLFTITDHFYSMGADHFYPVWVRQGNSYPLECWTTLSAVAAITSKIKIGPLVTCALYRNPAVLAKMATTLDIISNGRLVLGMGAGWHENEFKAFMGSFPSVSERLGRFEEAVIIVKSMLENEKTSYEGKYYRFPKVVNIPQPIQKPHPPIMIGGAGEKKLLKIAARYADAVELFFNLPVEVVSRKIAVLKEHCKSVGRDYSEITPSVGFFVINPQFKEFYGQIIKYQAQVRNVPIEKIREGFMPINAPSEEYIKIIQKYVDLGIKLFTFLFIEPPLQGSMLKFFGEKVLPTFKRLEFNPTRNIFHPN